MTLEIFHDQSPLKYGTGPVIELGTPESAVRLASVARHIIDCATPPVIQTLNKKAVWLFVFNLQLAAKVILKQGHG